MKNSNSELIHEAKMVLSAVASHGPTALVSMDDSDYVPRLIERLTNALIAAETVATSNGRAQP